MSSIYSEPLNYRASALDALDELGSARTYVELLHRAHDMWCGPQCPRDTSCRFLHYPPTGPSMHTPASYLRPGYNKDTAHLYTLMGSCGYKTDTPTMHHINTWPLLESALRKVDDARNFSELLSFDYTGWTVHQDSAASQSVRANCRDVLQWAGLWNGLKYDSNANALHYTVFAAICDDMCIPPLDLVNLRLMIFGRSIRDVIEEFVIDGWGNDALYVLLALIRQYICQYIEKVEHNTPEKDKFSIHAALNRSPALWDSVVYRTHTANSDGSALVVAHVEGLTSISKRWLDAASICNSLSMDLAKSAMRIYRLDIHKPTKISGGCEQDKEQKEEREVRYNSIYLDLVDDLYYSSAPETLMLFGTSGIQFVPMNHRYQERGAGHRFEFHPALKKDMDRIYGDNFDDPYLNGLFHLRWVAGQQDLQKQSHEAGTSSLCSELSAACITRQHQRKLSWMVGYPLVSKIPVGLPNIEDGHCDCARASVDRMHGLAHIAKDQHHLWTMLSRMSEKFSFLMSDDGIDGIGSKMDIWALSLACKFDCGDGCEWAAFSRCIWKRFGAEVHTSRGCLDAAFEWE